MVRFRECLLAGTVFLAVLMGCSREAEKPPPPPVPRQEFSTAPSPSRTADVTPNATPRIDIHAKRARLSTSRGVVTIDLFAEDAPKTVENFIRLARDGFYDGLSFHRVVENSIVQTGDPTGTGYGGSGTYVPFEENGRRHLMGAVGMARSDDELNSASSQFYIALRALPELDGKYTVFGQVVEGLGVVRRIRQGDTLVKVEIVDAPPKRD